MTTVMYKVLSNKFITQNRILPSVNFSSKAQKPKKINLKGTTAVTKKPRRPKQAEASFIKASPITFNIVLNQLGKTIGFNCDLAIKEVITFHNRMIKNHSVVEGTARFNSIRLYAIKMLEGQNPAPLDRVAVGKKDRWPSAFNLLRPLYYRVRDERCSVSDRIIRSILYLNRLCEGNDVPDFTEIEKSFDVPQDFRERFQKYCNNNVSTASLELITKPSTRVLSNGPNGKPKWQTVDVEAYALLRSEIHEPFRNLCMATGNNDLYEYMKFIADSHNRVDRKRLRYITTIRDKGNKCRLVAISDYWTQVLLEPIMRDTQSYIKSKYKNVSYSDNHAKGFINLKKFIRPGVKCYDVSSWTDAFPATLQLDFMTARYGSHIAKAWYELVVSCKWNVKGSKSLLEYKRGQGMGTNGSFDIATATDLVLLDMIYSEEYGMSISASTYNKVGDDLWCFDPLDYVLNTYTEKCGISINQSKTKQATKENLCGEFVSRSINYGKDVSRISANICRAVKKNPLDIPQLAFHLQERNYESIIPLLEIFDNLKIKEDLRKVYVRTFYVLCELYPERGLDLLKDSLKEDCHDIIQADEVISVIKSFQDINVLKDSFNSFLISSLLNSIADKTGRIFDSAGEFDSSEILSQRVSPEMWWTFNEPIGLLTSKHIMAKSFGSLNEMYRAGEFGNTQQIVDVLTNTDQSMTFKELGVISTSGEVWRPKATKLYKFCKSLVVPTFEQSHIGSECESDICGRGGSYLATSIELPVNDPIFGGVSRKLIAYTDKVIGQSEPHSGHFKIVPDDTWYQMGPF